MLVLVLATMTFALAGAPPADAAGCCSVKRDGNQIVVSGTLAFRGPNYLTSFLQGQNGYELAGQRCAVRSGSRSASIKLTMPIKYVPNGLYRVVNASANDDYTRYFSTPGEWFRVTNSPAVRVEVTAGPPKILKATSTTFRFRTFGAVRKQQCQFDGETWRGCSSPKTFSDLSEGRHTVKVRAVGGEGFTNTQGRTFRVDTLPPTPPKLTQTRGFYVVTVTASGSRDPGSGIHAYEYQTFQNGEPTSPIVRADSVDVHGAETPTVVRFSALDRAGRRSAWSETEPITPTE